MTRFQLHVQEWRDCHRCDLAKTRDRIVLARGSVPAQVLLVGEGPGKSEDAVGQPFIGPAGVLLDEILHKAIPPEVSYCISNLVACLPVDPETGEKAVTPDDDHVRACSPRLVDLADIVRPRLLVCVGHLSETWLEPGMKRSLRVAPGVPQVKIDHPARILRSTLASRGLMVQRNVVVLMNAVEEHILGNSFV